MDRSGVQAWLDRYVAAWKSYDADDVAALFSPDAVYRYHPWDEGDDIERGRQAIVRAWLEPDGAASERDEPGTFEARYEPYAVDGDRAVAVGWSRYFSDASRRRSSGPMTTSSCSGSTVTGSARSSPSTT